KSGEADAIDINASGVITGTYEHGNSDRGFVRAADGTFTIFDPSGSVDTEPRAINASGDIIGTYDTADKVTHGFLRKADGSIQTTDDRAAISATPPVSINDAGVITGCFKDASKNAHGFIRTP